MDPVTGAVVIAGLKYVGKPSVDLVKDFLGKVLNPAGEALGEAAAQPIRDWQQQRAARAERVILAAATIVAESGQEPKAVPGRILWPVLEKSSIEEDSDLQRRWIALLANASIDADTVQPAFPHILGQLSPLDATVLDWMLDQSPFRTEPPTGSFQTVTSERIMTEFKLDAEQLVVVLANLDRNNLVVAPTVYSDPANLLEHRFQHTHISTYGIAFVRACQPPKKTG